MLTCLFTSRGLLQGHPFNAALTENRAMVNTLQYGGIGFTLLVLDLVPGFNGAISLARIRHQRHALLYNFCRNRSVCFKRKGCLSSS